MSTDTETKPQTSEGEGVKTVGEETGAGTQTATTEERTFSQAQLDEIIRSRLAEQEKAIKRKQAEDEAAKQGEWKQLADDRAAELADVQAKLAPAEARVESLEARLHKIADARLEDIPEKSRARVPKAGDATAEARLEKIEEILALMAELPHEAPKRGLAPGPRPAGNATDARADEIARAAQRRSIPF